MPKSVDTNIQVLPSGIVLNSEIDLPAAPALPSDNKYSVNWFSLNNGSRLAYITGDRDTADSSQINIQVGAENDLAHSNANLQLGGIRSPAGFSQVSAAAEDPVNGRFNPVIIRSDGTSSFLQFGGTLNKSIGGRDIVTWPGAVTQTSIVITHNLGHLNVHILCSVMILAGDSINATVIGQILSLTQSTLILNVVGAAIPAVSTTCHVDWFAYF